MEQHTEQKKRPVFLTVLAILSFITIGLGLLGALFGFLAGPLTADQMEQILAQSAEQVEQFNSSGLGSFAETYEQIIRLQQYINNNFYLHNLVSLAGLVLGLIGVIFMLKGNRSGFHLYIMYNLVNLLLVYVSVPVDEVPSFMMVVNLVFSALFIFLYSRNLHWMKA
ncbi:MAG: hypothetical protein K0R65_2201 [Crocinitomicaceae bacterium]|jgi:hypothetical protein|nr:hypothetical protein [Crocinitomicaceae bacterium]